MMPRTYILIGSHLALALVAGTLGWKLRDADYQAHLKKDARIEARAQQVTRELEGRLDRGTQAVREDVAVAQAHTEVVYRTVTKEVPVYVTRTQFEERVVAAGGLPAGFVWLHNQAASGSTAPLPPSTSPDAPTGLGMSDLAGVIAGNYAVCEDLRARDAAWTAWYERLLAEWPTSSPPSDKD